MPCHFFCICAIIKKTKRKREDSRKIVQRCGYGRKSKKAALEAGRTHDSFYLYDEAGIVESIDRLKRCFPKVNYLYSLKCNPDKNVLNTIFRQGFGADAASLGEVILSENAGVQSENIFFSAPGKTSSDIEASLGRCILIADSINEISKIQTAAKNAGLTVKIGIRINPNFTFGSHTGSPSKFGIDEAAAMDFLKNTALSNVKITGIHVHLRSQELDGQRLIFYWKNMLILAGKFQDILGELEYINMGSGIGIQYTDTDPILDLASLGSAFQDELDAFCAAHPSTKIIIETGRYPVCNNGWYVTKVVDRKVSCGKTFVILNNTLNGFLRPALAKLIAFYTDSKKPVGTEPLFTAVNPCAFIPLKDGECSEKVTLVGNLCTAADVIAEDIAMPYLAEGDLIALTNAGGYAAVLSPMQFSSQTPPAQIYLTADGSIIR